MIGWKHLICRKYPQQFADHLRVASNALARSHNPPTFSDHYHLTSLTWTCNNKIVNNLFVTIIARRSQSTIPHPGITFRNTTCECAHSRYPLP